MTNIYQSTRNKENTIAELRTATKTLIENDIERSPELHQNDAQSGLRKVASAARFDLTGVPVTEADPLGALSNSASPTSTLPKSATTTDLQTNNLNTKRPSLQV